MKSKTKKLSNPFSTGSGGSHFEAHVQASFVALMLTGGYAPCLPSWPIVELKLQGKIDGFDTDDLIVFVEKGNTKERRKLLAQIKHSISITKYSPVFGEVMQAAWNDFNNQKTFSKGRDIIALITGPLNATDAHNVQWLLSQARHTKGVDEFFRNVDQFNFSPPKSGEKLAVFQHHLKSANGGVDVPEDELYSFLKHFHLLGYDLGKEVGVVLSLIHSHISQFQKQCPQWIWSKVVDFVQTWNQDAGTITRDNLPEDLAEAFEQRAITEIPKELKSVKQVSEKRDWSQHSHATDLALANLVGAWNEKNESDIEVLTELLGTSYGTWVQKAREILQYPDSPLSLKNGQWKMSDRVELWNSLGSRIFDQDLDTFKSLVVAVLTEQDPSFELPTEDRYAASIHGKVLTRSHALRKGLAEGLAILGSNPGVYSNCSKDKAEITAILAIREMLTNADWVLWGSLNSLLPTLAEAAPDEFLIAVESTLRLSPCPFDQLFAQEGNGITGRNYITGLLWAMEGLAWDEKYLVRVCVILGELASHDPGGQWANRPANSLKTILLPWLPQTLASVEKRLVAVQILSKEWPDICWDLIIHLLPNQLLTSSGSHKPSWRKTIPDDWDKSVTPQEYWQQVSFYAELAVSSTGNDLVKLAELIDHFDNLPKPAFDHLIEILSSDAISSLPEEQRLTIWHHLTKFIAKHRRFAGSDWALSNELLTLIEAVDDKLAPTNPFNLYQHLFSDRDFDLYEEKENWEEQQQKLDKRRENAIEEIFQWGGIQAVIQFAESVLAPFQVGIALGGMTAPSIEQVLLPDFLASENQKHSALVSGYIWKRHYINGWAWCDGVDKTSWSDKQVSSFLTFLPFVKESWERASLWLGESQGEYWASTSANAFQAAENLDIAIEKLIEYGRPHAAINCLSRIRYRKLQIKVEQCIRALLAALSSREPAYAMDDYHIVELIKFLQADTSVSQDDLYKVEWAYLPLLERHRGATPKSLESRLARDPEFFCEVLRLIYRSDKKGEPQKEPTEKSTAIATNAWRLLDEWRTPPGMKEDRGVDVASLSGWLKRVKELCAESGHLTVALITIGGVLFHSPADPDGLWINRIVAEALNDRDSEDMRRGYRTAVHNARGAHFVDPTGKPEKALAEKYRQRAEDIENAGFQRLAVTLRSLADDYEREAERNISEHKERDDI
jgi:hypothetical protein